MSETQKDTSIIKDDSIVLGSIDMGASWDNSVCTVDGFCYNGDAALNTDPEVDVTTDPVSNRKGASSPEKQGQFASKAIGGKK